MQQLGYPLKFLLFNVRSDLLSVLSLKTAVVSVNQQAIIRTARRVRELFRVVLSLYLILVAILGPGLCCCAVGPFLKSKCEAKAETATPKKTCCHHHGKHHTEQASSSSTNNQHDHQRVPFCPCNQHQDVPVAPTLNASSLTLLDLSQELHNSLFLQSFVAANTSFSVTQQNCTHLLHLVQLSAQDSLRAPFVLLC